MKTGTHRTTLLASAAVTALLACTLAACGSDDEAASAESVIKVGNVSAVTGPFALGDTALGAEAFFEAKNADGGINGARVDFIMADDKTDPALSARAARDLVQQEKVVALVGDLSLVGCGVNRNVLEQNNVRSIMVGSDPACFSQPNVAPVNTGHISGWRLTMVYAAEVLKKENICAIFTNQAVLNDANDESIAYFEETTGQELAWVDKTLGQNSNLSALFAKAKQENCDVVLTDGTIAQTGPMVKARDEQGLDIPLIFQGGQYNDELATSLGDAEDVYSIAEMEPFDSNIPIIKQMNEELAAADVKVSSLSQFGWFSAYVFAGIAETIDGPVTRDSMEKALLELDEFDTQGMTASPFTFGDAESHNPNRGGKIVKIVDGKWVVESEDWLVLPENS